MRANVQIGTEVVVRNSQVDFSITPGKGRADQQDPF